MMCKRADTLYGSIRKLRASQEFSLRFGGDASKDLLDLQTSIVFRCHLSAIPSNNVRAREDVQKGCFRLSVGITKIFFGLQQQFESH
eukprot:4047886-Amphidinium_carterae.1